MTRDELHLLVPQKFYAVPADTRGRRGKNAPHVVMAISRVERVV